MRWLRLFAYLRRLTIQLKRVADGLDRLAPPPAPADPRRPRRKLDLYDLSYYDPEADFEAEQEEARARDLSEDELRSLASILPSESHESDI